MIKYESESVACINNAWFPRPRTSLFVHEQIIITEESSELGGSVSEHLEHVWQEATLRTKCVDHIVWYCSSYIHIYSTAYTLYKVRKRRRLGALPSSPPPPSAPQCRTAGFSCKAQDSG